MLTHLLGRLQSGEGNREGRHTKGSLQGLLESLWLQHGLHLEKTDSLHCEGEVGQARVGQLMDSYRETPLTQLGSWRCQKTVDFTASQRDVEGDLLPKENFLLYELSGGARCALRPSGTEAKIKLYTFTREQVDKQEEVARALAQAEEKLKQLNEAFKKDVLERLAEPKAEASGLTTLG